MVDGLQSGPRSRFVALPAIGAFYLAGSAASGVALELWTSGRIVFQGPPRFEPTLAVAAFVGAFVGWRLGRWRGVLAGLLYGLFGFLLTLLYPLEMGLRCGAGEPAACRLVGDLDFVIPQSWLIPGAVLGVVAARLTRWPVPALRVLEAFGIVALVAGFLLPIEASTLRALLARPDGIYWYGDLESAIRLGLQFASAVIVAMLLVRRSRDPRRDGLLVAGLLVLLALPEIAYQLRFPEGGLEFVSRGRRLVMALLIVLSTFGARTSTPSERHRSPDPVTPQLV
jgi:hypothetical protein